MHIEQYIRCCAKKFQTTLFFGFLYLTQNGTNYNEIFTCDRAKRYLQPVTLKNGYCKPGVQIQPEVWLTIFFEDLYTTMYSS